MLTVTPLLSSLCLLGSSISTEAADKLHENLEADFDENFEIVTQFKVLQETHVSIKPLLEEKDKAFFSLASSLKGSTLMLKRRSKHKSVPNMLDKAIREIVQRRQVPTKQMSAKLPRS